MRRNGGSGAWLGAAAALAGAAGYTAWVRHRNRTLGRSPLRRPDGRLYPESGHRFSDGARVSLVDVGPEEADGEPAVGAPLFLLPGADGIKETFRYQIPAFAERHRVVCADIRGEFPSGTTFDRLVEDVVELLDARGVERAVLLGQSLGGPIAMRAAVLHPERVAGLILSNTLARVTYSHVGANRAALIPLAMFTTRYLPTALGRAAAHLWSRADVWVFDSSPGSERVVDYALFTGPRTVSPSVSSRRVQLFSGLDLRPSLAQIHRPALVVKGPLDHYCPPAWSREIARLLPDARYEEVPGTGHCSHVSMPAAFNRIVLDWLAERAADLVGGSG